MKEVWNSLKTDEDSQLGRYSLLKNSPGKTSPGSKGEILSVEVRDIFKEAEQKFSPITKNSSKK